MSDYTSVAQVVDAEAPTPTATVTLAATTTPAATFMGTPTPTATPSDTPVASTTPTESATPTRSATPTATATSTTPATATATASVTATPTPSPTATATATPTPSPTATVTGTPTIAATPTPTPTSTAPGQLLVTGQTICFDTLGGANTIPCSGTGQDGELQKGLSRSYADNGDGTITDLRTGLMWEKLSHDGTIHEVDNTYAWSQAFDGKISILNAIAFGGHADWRVPNINELASIVAFDAVLSVRQRRIQQWVHARVHRPHL